MTDVPIARFPCQGTLRNQLVELVRYSSREGAARGASPVDFRVNDRSIDVFLDSDRHRREDLRAAGTAIADLELAMHCFLLDTQIEQVPDPAEPDWLARIWVLGAAIPAEREAEAMVEDPGNGACHPVPVAREVVRELLAEVAAQGALLIEVDLGPPRDCLVSILAKGEVRRCRDLPLGRRIARWIDLRRGRVPDPLVAQNAPAVFLLATREGDPTSHVCAGQASRRIDRRLAAHGLSARNYSEALAYADLREGLAMRLNPKIHVHAAFYIGRP